jgi:hypothetical protein
MTPWHAPDDPAASHFPDVGSTASRILSARTALFLYAALAIVLTWPLARHLGDHLPLGNNDLWQNYWNFWHWKRSLLELHTSPYSCPLIYQPGSVSLSFHTHSPANMLSLVPVAALFGEAAALNCALLLGFILSAWGGFLLARELTSDSGAAFLGGILFGFLPQHFEQSLEHLNLASCQGMPFFLLFLVRLLRDGGGRNVIVCGLFFAWNALNSWHNGVMVLLLGLTLAIHAALRLPPSRSRLGLVRDLAVAGFVATMVCLPFLWPLLRDWYAGLNPIKAAVAKGIDPIFLLLPSAQHPLWGAWFAPLYESWRTYPSVGFTAYLSLVALLTIAAAAVVRWRGLTSPSGKTEETSSACCASPRLWGALALAYLVLACGGELTIAGVQRLAPMPFALGSGIPVVETLRVANRLVIPGALAVAVLFSFSARSLLQHAAERRPFGWNRGRLFAMLAAFLVLDLLWLPYPLRALPQPDWIDALAEAPPGLLLNVPGGHRARGAKDLYFQTLHGRPIVGGYTSVPPEFMEERTRKLPWLAHAFLGRPDTKVVEPLDGFRDVLAALPVRVVVVHLTRENESLTTLATEHQGTPEARRYNLALGMPRAKLTRFREAIRTVCGAPHYADEQVEIYLTAR